MEKSTPRGIRNNNPLNLRRSDNAWLGKVEHPTDPAFEQFLTMEHGIRAALVNMRTIIRRAKGHCTLAHLIETWAPSTENNTAAYIDRVAKGARLYKYTLLDFRDRETIIAVAYQMAWVECGQPVPREKFVKAYDMV